MIFFGIILLSSHNGPDPDLAERKKVVNFALLKKL